MVWPYIIHSPEYGVFLREGLWLSIVSKVNPEDSDEAELLRGLESAAILKNDADNHDAALIASHVHHTRLPPRSKIA